MTRVLELAPLGLPRDEALQNLTAAGIQWTFGENQSICYCDLWKREGEVWHINVVLLFDEEGKLYRTRPEPVGITTEGFTAE